MAKQNIKEFVANAISDYLQDNNLEIWNIEYVKEGPNWFLRVYIDRQAAGEYVSMDDCQAVSEYLSDILDEAEIIEKTFYLEVSSPGLERELHTRQQLIKYKGSEVSVKLYRALDGKKKFEAILEDLDGDCLILNIEGKLQQINRSDIAKINLVAKW